MHLRKDGGASIFRGATTDKQWNRLQQRWLVLFYRSSIHEGIEHSDRRGIRNRS